MVARPMPEVEPTKTAMGEKEEREELAARMALIETILEILTNSTVNACCTVMVALS